MSELNSDTRSNTVNPNDVDTIVKSLTQSRANISSEDFDKVSANILLLEDVVSHDPHIKEVGWKLCWDVGAGTMIKLQLLYNDFEIKNQNDKHHLICGLLVEWDIVMFNTGLLIRYPRAKRLQFTKSELSINYIHSHCDNSGHFCFGTDTTIAKLIDDRKTSPFTSKAELEYFFLVFFDFLSWESLAGVPYKRFQNVIDNASNIINYYLPHSKLIIEGLVGSLVQNIDFTQLTITAHSNHIRVHDSEYLRDKIFECIKRHPSFVEYLCSWRVKKELKTTAQFRNELPSTPDQNDYRLKNVFFNGKHRPVIVTPDESSCLTIDDMRYRINDQIVNKIICTVLSNYMTTQYHHLYPLT